LAHLKRSVAYFAKIEELVFASLGLKQLQFFTLRFANNAISNAPKMDSLGNPAADPVEL
jgi:hypothetical protein